MKILSSTFTFNFPFQTVYELHKQVLLYYFGRQAPTQNHALTGGGDVDGARGGWQVVCQTEFKTQVAYRVRGPITYAQVTALVCRPFPLPSLRVMQCGSLACDGVGVRHSPALVNGGGQSAVVLRFKGGFSSHFQVFGAHDRESVEAVSSVYK